MSYDIIQFEMAVLVIGFTVNLMIGALIVLTAFTFMSRSVSAGAIMGSILFSTATMAELWIGREYIEFDTLAQIEMLTVVSILGAAMGVTFVLSMFEPQTPANMEVST